MLMNDVEAKFFISSRRRRSIESKPKMSYFMKPILPWTAQDCRWINTFPSGFKVMVMSRVPRYYTNMYVRTATLDPVKKVGFLQPLQGRTHQIKTMLSLQQKLYLRDWLSNTYPQAWQEADEHFQVIFSD